VHTPSLLSLNDLLTHCVNERVRLEASVEEASGHRCWGFLGHQLHKATSPRGLDMPEAWYPNPPPMDDGPEGVPLQTRALPPAPPPVPHVPHEVWSRPTESGGKKYLIANNWGKISKADKDKVRRTHVHGVEVRDLPVGHLLHGEQGLFATKRFDVCDIIGEVSWGCFSFFCLTTTDLSPPPLPFSSHSTRA